MKILSTLLLCLCSSALFAQNGFFLQPEIAAGAGNVHWTSDGIHWTSNLPSPKYLGFKHTLFSYQGTLDVGYKTGKWEFITGLGYFTTGYSGSDAIFNFTDKYMYQGIGLIGATKDYPELGEAKTYNRHIILPVKVGCQLVQLNDRWTFTPQLGAEFSYNMPRVFIAGGRKTESEEHFKSTCYRYSVFGLTQLNFEYKACAHIAFIAGLSFHYSLTPLVRDHQEFDYATLVNFGMRYNFKHKAKQP